MIHLSLKGLTATNDQRWPPRTTLARPCEVRSSFRVKICVIIRESSPSKNILRGQICYRVGIDDCETVSQPKKLCDSEMRFKGRCYRAQCRNVFSVKESTSVADSGLLFPRTSLDSSGKPGTLLSNFRGGKWQKSRQYDACVLRRRVHVLLVLASISPRKYGRNEQGGNMYDA